MKRFRLLLYSQSSHKVVLFLVFQQQEEQKANARTSEKASQKRQKQQKSVSSYEFAFSFFNRVLAPWRKTGFHSNGKEFQAVLLCIAFSTILPFIPFPKFTIGSKTIDFVFWLWRKWKRSVLSGNVSFNLFYTFNIFYLYTFSNPISS